jgi:hypothetical protein
MTTPTLGEMTDEELKEKRKRRKTQWCSICHRGMPEGWCAHCKEAFKPPREASYINGRKTLNLPPDFND